jgi:GNAT superfamily N-acetyltransferase
VVDVLAPADPIGPRWTPTDPLADAKALIFEYVASTEDDAGRRVPARVADLPPVLRVDCVDPGATFLAVLVAYVHGRPAGCVGAKGSSLPDCLEIARLFVRTEYRGLGLGRALMAAAHTVARSRGATATVLSVLPSRHAAINLYESLGYRPTAAFTSYPLVHLRRVCP